MKSGGGRTLGTGKEGIRVAQKLVGSEVPRRVCTEWKRRSCCWASAVASCTNSSDQAGYRQSQKVAFG